MSLSNPVLTNPAKHFFEWKGQAGVLSWYDKENQKNVAVKLPFEFIVLDQLSKITGYSKTDESGIWSNEVRSIMNDVLYTRTKKGPLEAKIYGDLGQTIKKGGKYAKSIYIAHKGEGGQWMIGNLTVVGSSLSAWIEFTKHHSVEKGMVVMTKGNQMEAPTGVYFPPVFQTKAWEDEDYHAAVELDRELQVYLSKYLTAPKVDDEGYGTNEPAHASDAAGATPEQQADFENRKAAAQAKPVPTTQPTADNVSIEDFQDEPINLDDIPF